MHLSRLPSTSVIGRPIDLHNIEVESVNGKTIWIKDGNARAAVIAPGDAPAVRAGQRISVSGNVEPDGHGGVHIRAERVR